VIRLEHTIKFAPIWPCHSIRVQSIVVVIVYTHVVGTDEVWRGNLAGVIVCINYARYIAKFFGFLQEFA
jgi:hypothetical protein